MDITSENTIKLKSAEPAIDLKNDRMREHQLRAKSRDLEAIFISQLFKAMEKTVKSSQTEGSNNLSTMMFSSVMGKAVAEQGGIGLAETIYQSLAEKNESNQTIDQNLINELEILSKIEYPRHNDE